MGGGGTNHYPYVYIPFLLYLCSYFLPRPSLFLYYVGFFLSINLPSFATTFRSLSCYFSTAVLSLVYHRQFLLLHYRLSVCFMSICLSPFAATFISLSCNISTVVLFQSILISLSLSASLFFCLSVYPHLLLRLCTFLVISLLLFYSSLL